MQKSSTPLLITLSISIFGIFSFIAYLFFYSLITEEPQVPKAQSSFYVHDDAELLSQEVEELIIDVNKDYESTTEKPQIVVSTVESLDGLSIEEYALESFEKLEIGSKNSDNGVLLLISEKEKQIKIEVGYGLEGAITDGYSGSLLDENLDYLNNNDYNSAVEKIFIGLASNVNEEYDLKNEAILGLSPEPEWEISTLDGIKVLIKWFFVFIFKPLALLFSVLVSLGTLVMQAIITFEECYTELAKHPRIKGPKYFIIKSKFILLSVVMSIPRYFLLLLYVSWETIKFLFHIIAILFSILMIFADAFSGTSSGSSYGGGGRSGGGGSSRSF